VSAPDSHADLHDLAITVVSDSVWMERPVGMVELQGTIVESRGPFRVEPPPDLWRWGTVACVLLLVVPIVVAVAAFRLGWRLVRYIVFRRPRGRAAARPRQAGWLTRWWTSVTIRPFRGHPPMLHLYDHIVETDDGTYQAVRQHGEFRQGRLFPGHRVRLWGHRSGGALSVRSAFDETTRVRLTRRPSPWRAPCLVAIFMLAALAAAAALVERGLLGS
jgi:hypothetical protein